MELVNAIYVFEGKSSYPGAVKESLETVVRLLAPFVPHVTEELWMSLGHDTDLETAGWPVCDTDALVEDEKLIVIQVNGKVRSKITVSASAQKDEVEKAALADETVQRFIEDKTVRKVIVVPGKLVNVVVG